MPRTCRAAIAASWAGEREQTNSTPQHEPVMAGTDTAGSTTQSSTVDALGVTDGDGVHDADPVTVAVADAVRVAVGDAAVRVAVRVAERVAVLVVVFVGASVVNVLVDDAARVDVAVRVVVAVRVDVADAVLATEALGSIDRVDVNVLLRVDDAVLVDVAVPDDDAVRDTADRVDEPVLVLDAVEVAMAQFVGHAG